MLGWGVLLGACRDPAGTALYVTIDFPPSLTMDQLRVSGAVAGSAIGPQLLPEQPERTLAQEETFRILLPSAPDKAEAQLQVEGLRLGTRVALGTSQVRVQEGSEVDITVRLEPTSIDGFCLDCPEGCCKSGICTTSTFNTCGTGGIACVTCDRSTADSCGPEGSCVCGTAGACDPLTTDACDNGQCKCGTGGPCGAGQECVGGRCVCTPASCANGCCAFNACLPGTSINACGQGGAVCAKCASRETCGNGSCN
ncbi:MAG: hypothetical protein JXB05_17765 [Myxococcaceae bacterium]|nr:hypothetical protein [Myxococcaceae bacterium]